LAAGFCPDPLGELQRSPEPLVAIGGGVVLLRGKKESGRRGKEKRGKIASSLFNFRLRVWRRAKAPSWRRGVVVIGVRRMNEVNPRWARLVLGWVTVFGQIYHLVV